MALELLSIALGLSSFEPWVRGRRVMIWSDNTGAESATKRGSARCVAHLPKYSCSHFAMLVFVSGLSTTHVLLTVFG